MHAARVRLCVWCMPPGATRRALNAPRRPMFLFPRTRGVETWYAAHGRNKQQEQRVRSALRASALRGLVAEASKEVRYALLTMKVLLLHLSESTRSRLAAQLRSEGADVHSLSSSADMLDRVAAGDADDAVVHYLATSRP